MGEVIRTSSLHPEQPVYENIACTRSTRHPLVIAFEVSNNSMNIVIDGVSSSQNAKKSILNLPVSPQPSISVSHEVCAEGKMSILGCHYCFLGEQSTLGSF